ncbi:MAG: TetR/AcrR family transcriptional regulator [Deltaproteobacteria bacterium]|nr:TetR/AcrR family transcriptional regulator [Deltaproteobacteria bacterium]MCL5276333.1 TetR/AcrR family transcriptional regulator [Deltaproteobacteria bacterium]
MKELIIKAAIKVYAAKGMQGIRIADIAKEAKVSYGLVYHYFKNKEDVLNAIFSKSINIFLKAIENTSVQEKSLKEKLVSITTFLFNACRELPEFMYVIMFEVIWTPKFLETRNFITFTKAFATFEKILIEYKQKGELRSDVNTTISTYMFFGGLEMILTGIVLKAIPVEKEDVFQRLSNTFISQYVYGLTAIQKA